jgi:hypothetical protein
VTTQAERVDFVSMPGNMAESLPSTTPCHAPWMKSRGGMFPVRRQF